MIKVVLLTTTVNPLCITWMPSKKTEFHFYKKNISWQLHQVSKI